MKSRAGFTLIELMIVVMIIGILSSLSISIFQHYQLKAKTSEAVANIRGIVDLEEVYHAEYGGYLTIQPTPKNNTPGKIPWQIIAPTFINGGGLGSFEDIGFRPNGKVYYTYAVATGVNAAGISFQEATVDASADLDGDSKLGCFAMAIALRKPVLQGLQCSKIPSLSGDIENLFPNYF